MDVMHRATLLAATALAVFSLGGCATTRGGPESVFDSAALVQLARSYSVKEVDVEIDGLDSDPAGQQRYRNKVIRAYLTAIDSQYFQFRSNLGLEGRGGGLGFDLLALGLATAGSLSMGAAPELAAAAGIATGSRAAIDKNLLFEKTLPALFASMDAARLRQRTLIMERMQGGYGDYPMEAAWNDLQTYQIAGTVDDAVSQVTDKASSDRESARAAYNRSLGLSCDAKADVLPVSQKVGDMARQALLDSNNANDAILRAKGRLRLENIAQAFDIKVSPADSNQDVWDQIANILELDYCDADSLRKRIDRIIP